MQIDNLSQDQLSSAGEDELHGLRLNFCQVYDQYCGSPFIEQVLPIASYASLVSEMKKRRLRLDSHAIDRRLFSIQAHERSIGMPGLPEEARHEKNIRIISKSQDDERIAVGIVYEPDETDAHGDYSTEDEIRKAAWDFMENGQALKVNHQGAPIAARVLESYIAPADFSLGNEKVKKGSWILTTRVLNDEIWSEIKIGAITGYSMAGTALIVNE